MHRFSIPSCTVYSCLYWKDTSSSVETSVRLTTRAGAALRRGMTNYGKRSNKSWPTIKSRVQEFAPISLDVWSNANMALRWWCTQTQSGTSECTAEDVDKIIDSHIIGGKPVAELALPGTCVNTARCEHKPRNVTSVKGERR
jgi:(2Fe-2S) ferredoxin